MIAGAALRSRILIDRVGERAGFSLSAQVG